MLLRQKIAMILICIFVFIFILELIRSRKLREEYAWLWLLTSLSMFIMVVKYDWLIAVSRMIGAVVPTTTLFLGAFIFLMTLGVQFSVRISKLTDQVKNLTQELALLTEKVNERERRT